MACAVLIVSCASAAVAADRAHAPKLPLAEWWSVALAGPVGAGPVTGGSRIFVAFKNAELAAYAADDGRQLWRIKKDVSTWMAAAGDLLLVASADAVEAVRGDNGASAWVLPRVTPVAPLVVDGGTLFVVTDSELISVKAATGEIAWRHAAGGVHLAPAVDRDRVYLGADDGRLLALSRADGSVAWESFFNGGVTALGAGTGRLYIGAGDKYLYCVDSDKKGRQRWKYQIGGIPVGRVAVDDERAYVAGKDNAVRGLDRSNGNQRWNQPLRERPTVGAEVIGRVVFVPAASNELTILYDRNGKISGHLLLPGEQQPNLPPAFLDSPDGAIVYAVSGGLNNEWHLTKFAPAGEAPLLPFSQLTALFGPPYLTDPLLMPIGNVLQLLIIGDPLLVPLADVGFPIVLRDPPLMPLTVLPGLQLRPLSPALPARRGGP